MKTMDFSETIEACDLKVGRYRQLIDFMKVCEYWFKLYFNYFIHTIQENYIQFIQDLTISQRLVLTSFPGV